MKRCAHPIQIPKEAVMNKKNTDAVKVVFTVIGIIVSIGALAVLAYKIFKKYFKVTFECDGDCDSCDEECDRGFEPEVIDSVPFTDEEDKSEEITITDEEDKSEE